MYNNPIAKVIRRAFINNVSSQPLSDDIDTLRINNIKNILRNKRISLFEHAINRFLTNSGIPTVPTIPQFIDEKKLLIFSLQLSGYIRDAQKELNELKNEHACDPDLINLYKAAAKYSADCTNQIEGSNYIFREHCDYRFYKIDNFDTLSNAKFISHGFVINPKRHNLILSMPFHIKDTQEELQFWTSKFMNGILDNKEIYGNQVDVYLACFPIEQPRGEKFALSLNTLRNPTSYFDDVDMRFVINHLSPLLCNDIKTNSDNKIVSGTPFDNEIFKQDCTFSIIGYCAGTAHAHRWINAFEHLALQLYDKKTTQEALQNIFVASFAFLPVQNNLKYSGAHFMSNYANDILRKEPFIKMFNPEGYEQYKFHPQDNLVHTTSLPDNRNHIIAYNLPDDFMIYDKDGQKVSIPDLENGHHMGVVTQPNANSLTNYPFKHFQQIVNNAAIGKRGKDVFTHSNLTLVPLHSTVIPSFYIQNQLAKKIK